MDDTFIAYSDNKMIFFELAHMHHTLWSDWPINSQQTSNDVLNMPPCWHVFIVKSIIVLAVLYSQLQEAILSIDQAI